MRSTADNRGGATSVTLAAQFSGNASVPLLLPLYAANPAIATGVAALVGFAAIAIVTLMGGERR